MGPEGERERILEKHSTWAQSGYRREGRDGKYTYDAGGGQTYNADEIIELSSAEAGWKASFITRSDLARAQKEAQENTRFDAEGAASVRLALKGTYADPSTAGSLLGSALRLGGKLGAGEGWKEATSGSLDYEAGLYHNYVGAGKLTPGELRTWLLGRKSGATGGYTTIESYLRDKQSTNKDAKSKFDRYNRAMRTEVTKTLSPEEAKRFGEGGSSNVSSASSAKEQLREGVYAAIGGRWTGGAPDWARAGNAEFDFAKAIASDTEAADAFSSLMTATSSGAKEVAVDRLKSAFGEGSREFARIQDLISDPEKMKSARERFASGGVDRLTSQSAAATSLKMRADKERAGVAAYRKGVAADPSKKWDPATEAAMDALVSAGETGDRRGAKRGLFSALAASGGDIDDNEKAFLTALTGDTSASTLAGQLGHLASESKEGRASAAKLLGVDEAKLSEAMKGLGGDKNYNKRLQKAIELASESGAIDDMFTEGGSAKTIAGTETAYVEANARFVVAVTDFVSALKTHYPKLKTTSEAVQGASSAIPGPDGN